VAALTALCAFALLAAGAPRLSAEESAIAGAIPAPGKLGLVTWAGGDTQTLQAEASAGGCDARSVWANRSSGGLIGYIFGAPGFVNAQFTTEYPGGMLPAQTPLILVCASASATVAPPPSSTPGATAANTVGLTAEESALVGLVNQARAAAGLPALVVDMEMVAVARAHSQDMAVRDFFSHVNPDGDDPFDRMSAAGIEFGYAGENLAMTWSVTHAHELLMNSPGHRANILGEHYARIGIGAYRVNADRVYFTQLFAD
jgi:uncharacterized protein YkwD